MSPIWMLNDNSRKKGSEPLLDPPIYAGGISQGKLETSAEIEPGGDVGYWPKADV